MARMLSVPYSIMILVALLNPPVGASSQADIIQIEPGTGLIGPATKLTVTIFDPDLDSSARRIDEYDADKVQLVTFRTDREEIEQASPDIKETGKNTGTFQFTLQLRTDRESCENDRFTDRSFDATGGSDPSIGTCPGDTLYIGYEDSHTTSGDEQVISLPIEIKSWDPEFTPDKESYAPEDRMNIDILDPDANRDSDLADTIRDIRVFSERDLVGKEFSALETGENTGLFRLSFKISTHRQDSSILVDKCLNSDVSVEYVDEFPAKYDLSDSTFVFTIPMASECFGPGMTVSRPQLSANGVPSSWSQATVATNVTNLNAANLPSVVLIEIRDSADVTVFLGWQSRTLEPNRQTHIGIGWTPTFPDDYEIRAFVISGFDNPRILSYVASSIATIS